MSEQQPEQERQEFPLDASPHVWLHHRDLIVPGTPGVSKSMTAGTDLVQVLSMEADGAWVRFVRRSDMVGWKVYVPREQIISIAMEDPAWPK